MPPLSPACYKGPRGGVCWGFQACRVHSPRERTPCSPGCTCLSWWQGGRGPWTPAHTNHNQKVWGGARTPQGRGSHLPGFFTPLPGCPGCEDSHPHPRHPSLTGVGEVEKGFLASSSTGRNRKRVNESELLTPSGTFQHGKPTKQLGKQFRDFN